MHTLNHLRRLLYKFDQYENVQRHCLPETKNEQKRKVTRWATVRQTKVNGNAKEGKMEKKNLPSG